MRILYLRVPKNKNERTRARWFGSLGIWGIWTYLRAHCWTNVANRADVRLSIRLIIHMQLIQIMAAPGENDWPACGGVQVPVVKLGSYWEIWQRRSTV